MAAIVLIVIGLIVFGVCQSASRPDPGTPIAVRPKVKKPPR